MNMISLMNMTIVAVFRYVTVAGFHELTESSQTSTVEPQLSGPHLSGFSVNLTTK